MNRFNNFVVLKQNTYWIELRPPKTIKKLQERKLLWYQPVLRNPMISYSSEIEAHSFAHKLQKIWDIWKKESERESGNCSNHPILSPWEITRACVVLCTIITNTCTESSRFLLQFGFSQCNNTVHESSNADPLLSFVGNCVRQRSLAVWILRAHLMHRKSTLELEQNRCWSVESTTKRDLLRTRMVDRSPEGLKGSQKIGKLCWKEAEIGQGSEESQNLPLWKFSQDSGVWKPAESAAE